MPPQHGYAGVATRAVALVIDLLIIGALVGMAATILPFAGRWIATVIAWLYFAGQESSPWMATIGKRLMGMVVIGVDGQRIGFWRASLRWACRWLSGLFMGLGYAVALFNDKTQTLHDVLAGTVVARR